MGLLTPIGWTDDKLKQKNDVMDELKAENDRVLKKQKEENDRLIEAINIKKNVPEPGPEIKLTEEEQHKLDIERSMEFEHNLLSRYGRDSECIYSSFYPIKFLFGDLFDYYKKALLAFVITLIIGIVAKWIVVTIAAFIILIITIIVCIKEFSYYGEMFDLYKKSRVLKKTKVYDELKKIINKEDFSKAIYATISSRNCSFLSLDDGDKKEKYYASVDFEKLGYPELDYEGQFALMRLVQRIIKKDLKRKFIFSSDIEFAREFDKPFRNYYICFISLTDAEYRKKKNSEIAKKAKESQKREKQVKKELANKKKSGETW